MSQVLITGGSGFIGHHVVDHLLRHTDHELVVLDSLTYAGDVSKLTYLESFAPGRCRIVWHDLRAPITDGTAEVIGQPDVILNLASASHVERSISDPVPFVQNNVSVALNALEFARQVEPKVFLQFSTDEVFGPAPGAMAFSEWDRHVPSNPYAASKSAQEAIAISYWRTYGVPVIITNTMNVFGERQHPEKFIPLATRRLLEGKPVPIHAEKKVAAWVSGSRYWLYVGDVASALEWMIGRVIPPQFPLVDLPERFNIVGEQELANDALVLRIAEMLGVKARMDYVDFHGARPGHDRRYALDGSKLASAGWRHSFGFEDGLKRTIEALI